MGMGLGDWGLGIGDWAQSPIPNPHMKQIIKKYIKNKKNVIIFFHKKNI